MSTMVTPRQLLRLFVHELKETLVTRSEHPQAFIEAFQAQHERELDAFFDSFLSHMPPGTMTFTRFKVASALTIAPRCVESTLDGTVEKERWVKSAVLLMRMLEAALLLNFGAILRRRYVRRFDARSVAALDLKDAMDEQSRSETPERF